MRFPLASLLLLLPCVASAAPTAYFTWRLETLAGCYTAHDDQYAFDGMNVGVGVTGLIEPYVAYALDIDSSLRMAVRCPTPSGTTRRDAARPRICRGRFTPRPEARAAGFSR